MYLLCDWGTSSFRIFLMDDTGSASPAKYAQSDCGISRLDKRTQPSYLLKQAASLVDKPEDTPVFICGMAGSPMGLVNAGYVSCPAELSSLANGLMRVKVKGLGPVSVVPGVSDESGVLGADVMRGEETQVMGWLQEYPQYRIGRHRLCLPGTHSKWVQVDDGVITAFKTVFTGEMYHLLTEYSTLRTTEPSEDGEGFADGLWASLQGTSFPRTLFSARARVLLGKLDPGQVNAYLSGMLIGTEVKELGSAGDGVVHLVGGGGLLQRYLQAFSVCGVEAHSYSGDSLSIAGLTALASI